MRRTSIVVWLAALASAFALYAINQDTRRLAAEVSRKERERERLAADIDVLRAERAFLARPSRIEPLARAIGMQPALPQQHVDAAALDRALKP